MNAAGGPAAGSDPGRDDTAGEIAVRLLFVCTGNVCRSPVAERLARAWVVQNLGGAAGLVRVRSAGTRAVVGHPIHPDSAAALRGLGGDDTGFAAQRLTPALVDDADLVLTMTRDHRSKVLELAPRAMSRTFTLAEAAELVARLGDQVADSSVPAPGTAMRTLVRRLADARAWRTGGPHEDVPDPIGGPPEAHQDVAELIAGRLRPVLGAVLPVTSLRAWLDQ